MTAREFWERFLAENPAIAKDTPFQTWHFGNTSEMAAELAALVTSGVKTATASLAEINRLKPDEAPTDNGYSVVTDFDGRPVCVVRTTEIRHVPFSEVDPVFAFDEGEGDRSLDYWRSVHWDYFAGEALSHGLEFDEHSIICCERFRLLYPPTERE